MFLPLSSLLSFGYQIYMVVVVAKLLVIMGLCFCFLFSFFSYVPLPLGIRNMMFIIPSQRNFFCSLLVVVGKIKVIY